MQKNQTIEVIYCVEKENGNPLEALNKCIVDQFEDGANLWIRLVECAKSDTELRDDLRKATEMIGGPVRRIPEIVIDGQRRNEVAISLVEFACGQFEKKQIKPRYCVQLKMETFSVTVFAGADSSTMRFVIDQVKPLIGGGERSSAALQLSDVIRWRVVAWGDTKLIDNRPQCPLGEQQCLINRLMVSSHY